MSSIFKNQPKDAWPVIEARRILDRIQHKIPSKGYVLFETGYGPSGLPHIGTFGEIVRTVMVQNAFTQLSGIPTKLICFSDDMDGIRKVPDNVPNAKMIAEHLGKPLTAVPDPFEVAQSYGHYMNAKMCTFLDRFGFKYAFYSATECYKSGMFDHMLVKVLENYDAIMALMLPTLRAERQVTYSPFMPICSRTGKVLQVPIDKIDVVAQTIIYKDMDGSFIEVPVTRGHCKLQWKPDFGMRWAALDVDYEMYGKDHMSNAGIYSKICNILGKIPPVQFFYEMFLADDGSKISKSKGNSISLDEWLHYAPLESLSLFVYKSPEKAKRLHFDVIPQNVDEYLTLNAKYHTSDPDEQAANPAYHIHNGHVPQINTYGLTFSLLLNLAAVCNPEHKSVLWGFISKYAKGATPENAAYLDHLVDFAIRYYNDFIRARKVYMNPTAKHKIILQQLLDMLALLPEDVDVEQLQQKIYDIGAEAGYSNLRDYFKDLYQILLGQTEGPRLWSFIKLFGIMQTKALIQDKMTTAE